MPSKKSDAQEWIKTYTQTLIRWRWIVLLGSVLLVVGLASGARSLQFTSDYKSFFSKENPQLQAFLALQDMYTKDDTVLFALRAKTGDAFTTEILTAVEALTEGAWQLPFSTRVDSVTNYQHSRADEDDLIVERLVDDAQSLSADEIQTVRRIALEEPALVNRLVAADGEVLGVSVTIQLAGESPNESVIIAQDARRLAATIQQQFPQVEIYLSGTVMLNSAFGEATVRDASSVIPLMYLVLIVVMGFLLRSLSATLATLVIIFMSTATALGLAGWLGWSMTPPSALAPTMILTLAVADCVHVLKSLRLQLLEGHPLHAALQESLRLNIRPVFLTSATTAVGFLSLNGSEIPPFRDLGNITTFGILAAFVLSVTFLPAWMAIWPMRAKPRTPGEGRWIDRLADIVIQHHRRWLWGATLAVSLLAVCLPLNELNDRFVRYFDETFAFRTDTDFINEELTGIYQVEFSISSGESGGITDPRYLKTLDDFVDWWRQQPEVVHVSALSDTLKRLNRNMHGDAPDAYTLPMERELSAQYLLLYEMSLPYGLDLNNQIDIDKSATRVIVTLKDLSTREIRQVTERGENWLQDHGLPTMQAFGVGPTVMFSNIYERNTRSLLKSGVLALVLISISLIFVFRSLWLGLFSLIPNLIPAVMAFGVWGLWVGEVSFGLSAVVAMTLGIVVDDTVHFLSKYLRARREHGLEPVDAIRHAFRSVGDALIVTSMILVAGFLMLSTSSFAQNADTGKLAALTILFALLADLILLPPLLILFDKLDFRQSPISKPRGLVITAHE